MNLPKPKQWATVYANNEFISVNTCSGFRRFARDPEGIETFFSPDVSDEELGSGILQSLSASKFLSLEKVGAFFDLKRIEKNYESWVKLITEKFGYKSRREVFKGMKHCTIECVDGVITIEPTNHEKLEAWSGKGLDINDNEVVNITASEIDIAQALRRCLNRCI